MKHDIVCQSKKQNIPCKISYYERMHYRTKKISDKIFIRLDLPRFRHFCATDKHYQICVRQIFVTYEKPGQFCVLQFFSDNTDFMKCGHSFDKNISLVAFIETFRMLPLIASIKWEIQTLAQYHNSFITKIKSKMVPLLSMSARVKASNMSSLYPNILILLSNSILL